MKINYILNKLKIKPAIINHNVAGLFFNSKDCIQDSVFFLMENNKKYLTDAINNGATTIITDNECYTDNLINYIKVLNVKKTMCDFARVYYKDISKKMKLIGFIGTNAKTTCSTIGYKFFNYINYPSMLIGSNGINWNNNHIPTNNTTPDILTIYKYLDIGYKEGIKYVFMELSSIGISELRIEGLIFDTLVLTNLKQDHLDYHKTLDNYYHTKSIPFIRLNNTKYAVINIDDSNYKEFIKYLNCNVITYGINNNDSSIKGNVLRIDSNGSLFTVNSFPFRTKLLGEFNIYNCLTIISLLSIYNLSYLDFSIFIKSMEVINGRMNKYCYNDINIIIDYAHTYSAVKEAISFVRNIAKKDLYVIVGCGGNREKEKRYMIGTLLNELDINIVLTTDNPRFEEPIDIINDIKKNITHEIDCFIDRKEAITKTLEKMKSGDYLLILGKGNESYMEIAGIKYPYNDLDIINGYFKLS